MAALYSKMERKIHRDATLREFPPVPPNPITMHGYLLCNEAQTAFPGLYVLRLSTAADDLRWSVDDVRAQLGKLVEKEMVRYDGHTGVVWLPKALRKHVDGISMKNAKGWRNAWDGMPDCPITREAFCAAVQVIHEEYESSARCVSVGVQGFTGKPPRWWSDTPSMTLRSPFEAPSKPLLSPIDVEEERERKEREEGEGEGQPPVRSFAPAPHGGKSSAEHEYDAQAFCAAAPDAARLLALQSDSYAQWVVGMLKAIDPAIPSGVCPAPLVRFALAELRRALAIDPALVKQKRLRAFERELAFKLTDDRNDGWKFCRSGGTDGRLATKVRGERPSAPSANLDAAEVADDIDAKLAAFAAQPKPNPRTPMEGRPTLTAARPDFGYKPPVPVAKP